MKAHINGWVNMKQVSIENIIAILNEIVEKLHITENELDDDLEEKGMDSMEFVMVIAALEDEFDLEIPDSKLIQSEMNTINKINAVLTSLQSQKDA